MTARAHRTLEPHVDRTAAAAAPPRSDASEAFRRFASAAAWRLGSHWAFLGALAVVLVWLTTGPLFRFSNGWQLVINTGTTIVTFLMVFVIQSTQNRDAKALHLKLDELIRTTRARNAFAALENATDEELDSFEREFEALRKKGGTSAESRAIAAFEASSAKPQRRRHRAP